MFVWTDFGLGLGLTIAGVMVFVASIWWSFSHRKKTIQIRDELQTILDALEPVALIDRNYTIIRVNELYASAIGRNYQSLLGRKCYEVHENRTSPCPGCQLYKALLERKPQLMPAVPWRRDNHTIYYDISFHPVFDPVSRSEFVVEVKKDITTLHNIRISLEEQGQLLEQRNEAISEVNQQLAQALDEKNHDLSMAQEIQRSLLPSVPPQLPGIKVWSTYEPIQEVGGDLYDFLDLGEHRLGIFIGDVSGHGLPAAFIASIAKLSLHHHLLRTDTPVELLRGINMDMLRHLQTEHYLTAFYGILDLKTNILTYARAAHPPALLLQANTGAAMKLAPKGVMLGRFPDPKYQVGEVKLEVGDRLFLFTDGCYGWTGKDGRPLWRHDDFCAGIAEITDSPLETIYPTLLKRLQRRSGDVPDEDDRTFIALEITKRPLAERYRYVLPFSPRDRICRTRIQDRRQMDEYLERLDLQLQANHCQERNILAIVNSVQEAIVNSIVHGMVGEQGNRAMIAWSISEKGFRFSITDKGPGFQPESFLGVSGRFRKGDGLLLMRTYMDEVGFANGGRTTMLFKSFAEQNS